MANSVDPDQTPQTATLFAKYLAQYLGLLRYKKGLVRISGQILEGVHISVYLAQIW